MPNWWDEYLLISAVQCNYGEDSRAILRDHVVKGGYNAEQLLHLTAEGHMAAYDEDAHGAKLDAYLAEAHAAGIREILYWNTHCVSRADADAHPDWVQLDRDSQPFAAYDVFAMICVNSPWSDQYKCNLVRLCRSHAVDGLFLDGPLVATGGCYCAACRAKFEARFGKSLRDADKFELLAFKVDSITAFVRDTYETVKSINPAVMVYLNNNALMADVTGSSNRALEPYVDMLGAEGGFAWVDRGHNLLLCGAYAKYLASQAGGKPTVIFLAGDHKPSSYYMHTAAEVTALYAQSAANGANVWHGIHGPTWMMDSPGGRAALAMNAFLGANRAYLAPSQPVARVALMWSGPSANFYSSSVRKSDFIEAGTVGGGADKRGNHHNAFLGFYEMLTRSHIPFAVIDEVAADDPAQLAAFDLVILPTCGCLSRANAEALKAFVRGGGNLISTHDTGFFDERGEPWPVPVLAELQGIESAGGMIDYSNPGTGYLRVEPEFIAEIGRSDSAPLSAPLIPAPPFAVRVTPAAGPAAKVRAQFLAPMPSRYSALSEPIAPALITAACGRGRCAYFAGTAGEYFFSKSIPDYRKLFAALARGLSSELLETDAPGSVEIELRRQPAQRRYVLHLINMTGEMARPIEAIVPLRDVHVRLRLPETVTRIRRLREPIGSVADFACENGAASFMIPMLGDYEIFVLEY